jgi:transcriptional regulator with PAS, ATPase and Fis domain
VDVRLVAATHHNLRKLMDDRQFRSDLYFRISTVPLVLPSLRERIEDIPELATQILKRTCSEMGRQPVELTPKAIEQLRLYGWPGNIRELRNVLERALLMSASSTTLDASDLFFEATSTSSSSAYNPRLTLEELERMHVESVYREEDSNVERTAQRLGIPKSTLYTKLRSYGLTKTRTANS